MAFPNNYSQVLAQKTDALKAKKKKAKPPKGAKLDVAGPGDVGDKGVAPPPANPGSRRRQFIAKAIKQPGALHRQLGVPQGKRIPPKRVAAAAGKGGKLGQRARFAQTLGNLRP